MVELTKQLNVALDQALIEEKFQVTKHPAVVHTEKRGNGEGEKEKEGDAKQAKLKRRKKERKEDVGERNGRG